MRLITADFMKRALDEWYDEVCSAPTFFHIADKTGAVAKAARLLNASGRRVLSIAADRRVYIDFGTRCPRPYPDDPEAVRVEMADAGLCFERAIRGAFAPILTAVRP